MRKRHFSSSMASTSSPTSNQPLLRLPTRSLRQLLTLAPVALAAALSACGSSSSDTAGGTTGTSTTLSAQDKLATATPIKHVVVIYGENISFDHYFGTYPQATNPAGEPAFTAATNTPTVINNLISVGSSANNSPLLINNPNLNNTFNAAGAANPFRLDRSQAGTAGQNHAYTAEQQAYHDGAADLFPLYTGAAGSGGVGAFNTKGLVMGYFDGNTVTAMWNYAQNFALSDNAYTSSYGPSTPGALNVISGQTNGFVVANSTVSTLIGGMAPSVIADGQGNYTLINDADPYGDVCSSAKYIQLAGKNVGDLLNAAGITWGGFMGGFNLNTTNANGTTGCKRSTATVATTPSSSADYIPHHNWFQYYASTANPTHARPSATAAIGASVQADGKTAEPANHQYDTDDFFAAVSAGNFPSVNFLKAPAYQDGHSGYSDPIDEQMFVTKVVNFLQQQPDWNNTVVIVMYDDSDGWYDHAYTAPTRSSSDTTASGQISPSGAVLAGGADQLNGPGVCGVAGAGTPGALGGMVNGRCGPGTRIPLLVISPWAKQNYVDHTQIDQTSVLRFIEDNWLGGTRIGGGSFDASTGSIMGLFDFTGTPSTKKLYLDQGSGATAGMPVATPPALNAS